MTRPKNVNNLSTTWVIVLTDEQHKHVQMHQENARP